MRSGFAFLRLASDEMVLDLGCGEGKESFELMQQSSCVISTDLSYSQLNRARQRISTSVPDTKVYFIQANAEELPFASGTFQAIYGKAILHHLDVSHSAKEIVRLLGPGGRATFAEPMAHHPLFELARHLTPRLRTHDEHPLGFIELEHFCACFSRSEIEEYFLLTPISYLFRILPGGESIFRYVHTLLQRIDTKLFGIFHTLRKLAWYTVIKIER